MNYALGHHIRKQTTKEKILSKVDYTQRNTSLSCASNATSKIRYEPPSLTHRRTSVILTMPSFVAFLRQLLVYLELGSMRAKLFDLLFEFR